MVGEEEHLLLTPHGFCMDCERDQELRNNLCEACGSSSILIRGAVLEQILLLMERDFPEEIK